MCLSLAAGQDYVPVDIPLTFTSNLTLFNITLEVVGDSVVEGDEVVVAELVVPEGESAVVLKSSRVALTIVDDDSMYSVSLYKYTGSNEASIQEVIWMYFSIEIAWRVDYIIYPMVGVILINLIQFLKQ